MAGKGRPVKTIAEQDIDKIKTLSGFGLTVVQIAAVLGVCKKTLERRAEEDERIKGAIEKGRAVAISNVTQTAYQQAISGKVPAMTMFWLKCRARWKETVSVEHTGEDGGPIRLRGERELSEEELEAELIRLRKLNLGEQGE